MENQLFNLILMSKEGDRESVLKIIEKFNPIINKYTRILNYDEDCKEELIVELIEIINKIPTEKLKSDRYIVSYISTSLKNKYIHISQKRNKISAKEVGEIEFNLLTDEVFSIDDKLILNNMLKDLTPIERQVIKHKYINGLRDVEIANLSHISRQAVNQSKKRALNKLKKKYLN